MTWAEIWSYTLEWERTGKTFEIAYRSLTVDEMLKVAELSAERVTGDLALIRQHKTILELIIDSVIVEGESVGVGALPLEAYDEVMARQPFFLRFLPREDGDS